jgi:membrane associated rhomboid family serine protease
MSLPPPPPPAGPPVTGDRTEHREVDTCYRHPNRVAGRRCTRCGRAACSDCLVQATVGSHCLECAKAARPDVRTRARFWSARQPTLVTYVLIVLNVLVFVWVVIQDPAALTSGRVTEGQAKLGLNAELIANGGVFQFENGIYVAQPDQWYRVVTSGFLHFGFLHLLFNMYLLYLLGQMMEPAIGRLRFALIYMAALLGGSAGALLIEPDGLHGGASGAVFGLMAAAFVGYRMRGVNPFTTGIGMVLVLNLVLTFALPGISIGGHLGGLVAGALCGLVVLAPAHRGYPAWASWVTPIVVSAASIAACIYAVNTA